MLRISKGDKTLMVSKGAFREIYSPSGWAVVDNSPNLPPQEPTGAPGELGGSKPTATLGNSPEGQNTAPERETLKTMSLMELKQYASLLGINPEGLKSKKEAIRAIRSHQK